MNKQPSISEYDDSPAHEPGSPSTPGDNDKLPTTVPTADKLPPSADNSQDELPSTDGQRGSGKKNPTGASLTDELPPQAFTGQTAGNSKQGPQLASENQVSDGPTAAPRTASEEVSDGPTTTPHTTGTDVTAVSRDDPLTWFAHQIGKPKDADFAEMIRWTNSTLVEESVIEYQSRWLLQAIPILDKLDSIPHLASPIVTKRTFLLLVTADYMHRPRYPVFQLPGTASRAAYSNWMKKPDVRAVYDELMAVMEAEVMEHELMEIRRSVRTTRISASRAAEVRAELLNHPNPWVALQSARDIMQSADRQTAAKGSDSMSLNISATLSETQVEQLLERAAKELSGWDSKYMETTVDGRPLVIDGNSIEGATPPLIPPPSTDDDDDD